MRAGPKRSKPAATGVWVVKRLPDRVAAQGDFEGLSGLFHEGSGPFQHGEGGMPFIQVADFGLDPQRLEQAPSADPEYQLLIKT